MNSPSKANPTLAQVLAEVHSLRTKTRSDRAWDIATKVAVPLVLVVAAWMVSLQVRVSVIESTRFTGQDGEAMRATLLRDFPPQWMRDDLNEIKERLRRLEERKKDK